MLERFEDMDQKVFSLVRPFEPGGEPDKKEKARLAGESFNELQSYFRRNSIWLSRRTNKLLSGFLERYKQTINNFVIRVVTNEDRYGALVNEWDEVWRQFEKESPKIREELEEEFRAAIGERRAQIAHSWKVVQEFADKLGMGSEPEKELNQPENSQDKD